MMTEIKTAHLNAAQIIATAQSALRIEAQGVSDLIDRVDASMVQATALVLACTGRVVVSGMGKSGHIARKIAATLASTAWIGHMLGLAGWIDFDKFWRQSPKSPSSRTARPA